METTLQSQKPVDRLLHLVNGDGSVIVCVYTEQNLIDPQEHVDGALHLVDGNGAVGVAVAGNGAAGEAGSAQED